MNDLYGKQDLVIGIANELSIAAGCARAFVAGSARRITGTIIPVNGGHHVMA